MLVDITSETVAPSADGPEAPPAFGWCWFKGWFAVTQQNGNRAGYPQRNSEWKVA